MTYPTEPSQAGYQSQAPSCYRHPGREAYITCNRCGRTICPDCMRAASVGFQCPECVRGGNRGVRKPQGSFGGRRSAGDPALVTKVLIGINVVVWVIGVLSNFGSVTGVGGAANPVNLKLGLIPFDVAQQHQYYRLITAAFIHFGIAHIGLNMFALWLIGRQLEPVLGRSRYLALYLVAAIGGDALAYLLSPGNALEGGASGAVFGLFAALFIVARRLRLETGGIVTIIALNFVLSFVIRGISWQAHLGGLVAGALVTAVLVYAPRGPSRVPIQVLGTAVVLAIAAAMVVYRTSSVGFL